MLEELLDYRLTERHFLLELQMAIIQGLMDESNAYASEHTNSLDLLEEFVRLLDAARASEQDLRKRLIVSEEQRCDLQRLCDERRVRPSKIAESTSSGVLHKADSTISGEKIHELSREELKDLLEALIRERNALRESSAWLEQGQAEAVGTLHDRIALLTEELQHKSREHTDAVEKLEDFVGLLESAHTNEYSALVEIENRDNKLLDMQAERDEEQIRYRRTLGRVQGNVTSQAGPNVARPHDVLYSVKEVIAHLRDQIERLKLEKEALSADLEQTQQGHREVVAALNGHIQILMKELNTRIRGSQQSASSALELLREIEVLQAAEGALADD
ncbi:unnamed protein product [Phytomonas sp. EM1]|nr:unnamed protein product [Phytomonas sp. EM1]|eukprot:CCW61976.1 unnamed protein product [Phytomonas sp. isolate EM1]